MLSCMNSAFSVQKEIALLYALYLLDLELQGGVRQSEVTIWDDNIWTCVAQICAA